jgi:GNAT superfamily N-acetyltransferase
MISADPPPSGRIEPYSSQYQHEVVTLFESVQDATAGTYPPKALLEHYYPPGAEGIHRWLATGHDENRYVFCLAEEHDVGGHIEFEALDRDLSDEQIKYWSKAFGTQRAFQGEKRSIDKLGVIKRLGVHPKYQGRAIGRQLLRYAIGQLEITHRLVPALVVLDSLIAAQALYRSEGAREVGRFTEATGEPMVSYIF